MDLGFERKLFSILSRILEDVEFREAYNPSVPNRRLEGTLGGLEERPMIQKVGLLLDIRALQNHSAWHEVGAVIERWTSENAQNVDNPCELAVGILSAAGFAFGRRSLYLGLRRAPEWDLSSVLDATSHDWPEALEIFCQRARPIQLDMLILGLPNPPESMSEDKSLELQQILRPLRQKIVWLIGAGVAESAKSIDPLCQARCLDFPQSVASCGETDRGLAQEHSEDC